MNASPLILVCFAVAQEGKFFRLKNAGSVKVQKLITGMGKKNAETALQGLLAVSRPRLVVSSGFAGGLRPGLASGTVLFEAGQADSLERGFLAAGAQPGRFVCHDSVCTTAQAKQELWKRTGADAVEMESGPLIQLCREQHVPCATARVILDTAEEDLPLDFNQLMTADQRLDPHKLTGALLRAPGRIPALMKLQKQSTHAAQRLGKVLEAALLSPGWT